MELCGVGNIDCIADRGYLIFLYIDFGVQKLNQTEIQGPQGPWTAKIEVISSFNFPAARPEISAKRLDTSFWVLSVVPSNYCCSVWHVKVWIFMDPETIKAIVQIF